MLTKDEEWLLAEKYHGEKAADFFADCKRLEAGEPLAYVIGSIPFLNITIKLDSKPLIPRPETEFWVSELLRFAPNRPLSILDLCAGSGCIGVALLQNLPTATVDFAEIESSHLPTIKKNLELNDITMDRYQLFTSDLFTAVPPKTYDLIVSNPPYIDPSLDRTESAVTAYEPHVALYGGYAGMELIENIIATAPNYLEPDGQLWLEHEPEQSILIAETAARDSFFTCTHKDQYQVERYSVLVLQ